MKRTNKRLSRLVELDHRYVWHPFTQMRDWLDQEPIVIARGRGSVLEDVRGRRYLDANASIWTNLHGHNHPRINAALRAQLGRIAHSSALGFANEPAALLAEQLVAAANPGRGGANQPSGSSDPHWLAGNPALAKVFYSDDGSTAMEVALKLAYQYARRSGRSRVPRFLALQGAYHGDTVGAVSLGHIDLFHKSYSGLLFNSDPVMAPYCYRCPFNKASPARADAREYRRCGWECVDEVEKKFEAQKKKGGYAGFVFEPLMQGAAGMIPQPAGWLRRVSEIARGFGAQLLADEVMTAFGRTGMKTTPEQPTEEPPAQPTASGHPWLGSLFACHQEGVQPDFLATAKGLTGGYLPMAATLTTQAVFDAFLGEYSEFKTFFHGHSFTGNQLGSAAALASLALLRSPSSLRHRQALQREMTRALRALWDLPQVGDVRQAGLVAGVELVKDWRTREPFPLEARAGIRVCENMAAQGVLTRPIGNVVVLMPPYSTSLPQLRQIVAALRNGIRQGLG